ncbi:MAG: 6-phosphofructokinase [Nitrospirae bacterium]|nr:6-phosphofructokinase [Nitrospirota bacterium]
MKTIAVLTSGGDAPGMNACIRSVVRSGAAHGLQVIGFRRGFTGLMAGDYIPLGPRAVANIIQRGGTFLGTSRSPEFKGTEGRRKAIDVLEKAGVEGLIVIGGDGSFRGIYDLIRECDIRAVGIPGTIDNDIYGTDVSIGFDTAVNTVLEAIDRIRDTAASHERLFFVEVMGRQSGFIALEVGLAGGAEAVVVPEAPTDIKQLSKVLIDSQHRGKSSSIVIVTEGDEPGVAFTLAEQVKACVGMESRVVVLGHIQRGGSPTAKDRVLATLLGAAAVTALVEGKTGVMVGEINNMVVLTPLPEAWGKKKILDLSRLSLVGTLAG